MGLLAKKIIKFKETYEKLKEPYLGQFRSRVGEYITDSIMNADTWDDNWIHYLELLEYYWNEQIEEKKKKKRRRQKFR